MFTTIIIIILIIYPIGCVMSLFISFGINAYYDIHDWLVYTYRDRNSFTSKKKRGR